jgi:rhamnogalacturonyl hydrolase YesR
LDRITRIEQVKSALLGMQRFSWEQGVAAQAFLEMGEHEWAILLARDAVARQAADGRLALMNDASAVTDPAANGEAVLYAAKVTGIRSFAAAAAKMADWLLNKAPRTSDGILYHVTNHKQVWVDSMYMAPPFLAVAGYYEEAVKQIEGFRKLLWNPEKKLYSHMWDDEKEEPGWENCWGVGNGWAAAGITRVIRTLPETMSEAQKRLIIYVREGIDGCLAYQRADGFFHNIIDNPGTFVETNLSQMLSYSIYRGVAGGWLDKGYLPYADKMREAVYRKVDQYGLVQGVCGAPTFDHPGTAPEGQAFFLLMEAATQEVEKL